MFGIPTPASLYIKLGAIAIVIILLLGGYIYVQSLRNEVNTLSQQHINDGMIIDSYKVVVDQNQKDNEKNQKLNKVIAAKFQEAVKEKVDLAKRLEALSISPMNAPMTEIDINVIWKDSMRCNELVTGTIPTPTDAMNTVCPDLVKVKP